MNTHNIKHKTYSERVSASGHTIYMVFQFKNGNLILHLHMKGSERIRLLHKVLLGVYDDIYAMKCMEKSTDMFGRFKFLLPQNLTF